MPSNETNRCLDITELYDAYHKEFKKWAKWHFSQYDSLVHEDVFHDALIIYWENCKKGKFQNLYVPLINLLIGIAHKLFLKKGSKNPLVFVEHMPESDIAAVQTAFDIIAAEERTMEQKTWLRAGFHQLGEDCQRLLSLFYYEQKKIPEIVQLMDYKNDNVASASKSRCLKKLKEILETHGKLK
jgi:DNA-directed RNA polymerase specialized sigma24 family protein